ncbi:hypothetical protein [Rhodovulum sp. YNF3179]|uniref:hypothetical protein n=1 Tax=Rhodovulum sp. YNF3179 TaxID=3425127 RepID=UPI003D342DC0
MRIDVVGTDVVFSLDGGAQIFVRDLALMAVSDTRPMVSFSDGASVEAGEWMFSSVERVTLDNGLRLPFPQPADGSEISASLATVEGEEPDDQLGGDTNVPAAAMEEEEDEDGTGDRVSSDQAESTPSGQPEPTSPQMPEDAVVVSRAQSVSVIDAAQPVAEAQESRPDLAQLGVAEEGRDADSQAAQASTDDSRMRQDIAAEEPEEDSTDQDTESAGEGGGVRRFAATEDSDYTFAVEDFDLGAGVSAIRIVTLPPRGTLFMGGTPATKGLEVSAEEIAEGRLSFRQEAENDNGQDYSVFTFHVRGSEGDWAEISTVGVVDLVPVNDAPTSGDGLINVPVGTSYTFSRSDFAFDDVDIATDGQDLGAIRIDAVIGGGVLRLGGDAVSEGAVIPVGEIPNLVFHRTGEENARIRFSVRDNAEDPLFSETTYTVFVNDPPESEDRVVTMDEDTTFTFSQDDFNFSDSGLDRLSALRIETLPERGTLALDGEPLTGPVELDLTDGRNELAEGLLTYRPAENENGAEYAGFEFRVVDQGGVASRESYDLTFNVTPINDAPAFLGDLVAHVNYEGTYTLTPEDLFFTDPDDDATGVSFFLGPAPGTQVLIDGVAQASRNFTAQELADGRVALRHDGQSVSFDVLLADGGEDGASGATGQFRIANARLHAGSLDPADGFVIIGDTGGDHAGWSGAGVGDINGDGRADIAIGAPQGDGSGTDAGAAYLVYGQTGPVGVLDGDGRRVLDLTGLGGSDGVVIRGAGSDDLAGWSIAAAGDVNNDAQEDFVLGAPGKDGAGAAYLIFGTSGGPAAIDLGSLAPGQGIEIRGVAAGDAAGRDVGGTGDVDGDGLSDLFIGAPGRNGGAGEAYVVFGQDSLSGPLDLASLSPEHALSLGGTSAGADGAIALTGAGDFNGDGLADILVGAPGTGGGAAFVVFGDPGLKGAGTRDLSDLSASEGLVLSGGAAGDTIGYSLANAGDFDGDGIDDLLIGAHGDDTVAADAGAAYLVYGKAAGLGDLDLANLAPTDGFKLIGVSAGDVAGRAVAGGADVNRDGYDDLLLGAPLADDGGTSAGIAYLVYGGHRQDVSGGSLDLRALTPERGLIVQGDAPGDELGASVALLGDVNADGFSDMLIGAPGADEGGADSGAGYVIFGGVAPGMERTDGTGGDDVITGRVNVFGDPRDDAVFAGAGADDIDGGDGDDALHGQAGDDTLRGGAGQDWLSGGDGSDTLWGGAGADRLDGGDGADTLEGGAGDDVLDGGLYDDVLTGGGGADSFLVSSGQDQITDFGDGPDTVRVLPRASATIEMRADWAAGPGDILSGDVTVLANGHDIDLRAAGGRAGVTVTNADSADGITVHGSGRIDRFTGGTGDDMFYPGTLQDTVDGGGGSDTIDISQFGTDIALRLGFGGESVGGPDQTFAGGQLQGIENVVTGAGDDDLFGNQFDNRFAAGGGDDTLVGGAGSDTLDYSTSTGSVVIRLDENGDAADVQDGLGGTDQIAGFENLIGGSGDDLLGGNAEDNLIDGRGGHDTADFGTAVGPLSITLDSDGNAAGVADGLGGIDQLLSIESLYGGAGDDVLTANAKDNTLRGGGGDDRLTGGAGTDTADFATSTGAVFVSLDENGDAVGVQDGLGGTDQLFGFENLVGGTGNDELTGNAQINRLYGAAGDDRLDGGAGDDRLFGDDGDDELVGGTGDDFLEGGAGADILDGGAGADSLAGGDGGDTLSGGAGDDTLEGGAGSDTVDLSDSGSSLVVDLTNVDPEGWVVVADGQGGTDRLKGIENVTGSNHDDTLTGDAGANRLTGGAGADRLTGGAGDDTLEGGDGIDTADYAGETGAVTVDLGAGTASGAAGADTLSGIENVVAGSGDDTLTGNDEDNTLEGRGGDDRLTGGAGDDTLDGGDGTDTADYAGATGAVTVDLSRSGAQTISDAEGDDTLIDIENVSGSDHDDALTGDAGANRLTGGAGSDTLSGGGGDDALLGGLGDDRLTGGAGDDALTGGGGIDTADYSAATGAVTVDLSSGAASGAAGADTLIGIENVTGSDHDDTLTGDAGTNRLTGGAGADTLSGGGGNDTLEGGDGIDTADYSAATGAVTVDLSDTNAQAISGTEGADTLIGIEYVIGGSGDDTLAGDAGANRLTGGAGADRLSGGGGDDTLDGGDGIDTADYSGAGDAVTVDLSDTTAQAISATEGDDTLIGIENVTGSDHDDTLTGDAGANRLTGGAGADRLTGGAGDDTLEGGDGIDTADYAGETGAVTVDLGAGTASGAAGADTLSGIENVVAGSGDDTLTGNDEDNTLEGRGGDDRLTGGAGDDTLDGGDGIDTADYAGAAGPVAVDLDAGAASGAAGDDTLIGIENVTGSDHDDILTGDAGANRLTGGAGADTFIARAGADHLDGGDGIDDVRYAASATGLTIDLSSTDPDGWVTAGADRLRDIENLTGSDHDDHLTGDAGANRLTGGAGDDTLSGAGGNDALLGGAGDDRLSGGAGDDTLEGGDGDDTADYSAAMDTVTVDLSDTTAQSISAAEGADTLTGIENVIGGSGDDDLTGDAEANRLTGGAGADTLTGGGGDDTLEGGDGTDTADYSGATGAVTVDLSDTNAQAISGTEGADTLTGIENVIGGSGDDHLTGDDKANRLTGGAGDDTLSGAGGNDALLGGAGDDTLTGGAGDDTLEGGDGTDTADYSGATGAVTVDLSDTNAQTISAAEGADTLTGIENVIGSDHDDALTGDAGANRLTGGAGADTLAGGAGNDTLLGGLGDDRLTGGAGDDVLTGGAGDDTLLGGAGDDTLTGGDGIDTADYSAATDTVTVDLSDTTAQTISATEGADTLTGIENVIGGSGDDTLTGDAGDNTLEGGAGEDTLTGGAGDDTLDGGDGIDTADYSGAGDAVTVDLSDTNAQTISATEGDDTLRDIENVTGSDHDDHLTGDAAANRLTGGAGGDALTGGGGNDTLLGGLGDDVLTGGAGDDTLTGGDGIDTADYGASAGDLNITLDDSGDATGVSDGLGGSDDLSGIENLTGGSGDDALTGNSQANTLAGGAGDDTLTGGDGGDTLRGGLDDDVLLGSAGTDTLEGGDGDDTLTGGAGNDTLDGGAGTDTADYSGATGAVTVDLDAGTASGAAGDDTLTGVENVIGSVHDDTLTGDDQDNRLISGGGTDEITGGAGNDVIGAAPQAVWTPLAISNLAVWFDGNDIDGDWTSEGTSEDGVQPNAYYGNHLINYWVDKSGNGHDLDPSGLSAHRRPWLIDASGTNPDHARFATALAGFVQEPNIGSGSLASVTRNLDGTLLYRHSTRQGWISENGDTTPNGIMPGADPDFFLNGESVDWATPNDVYDATYGAGNSLVTTSSAWLDWDEKGTQLFLGGWSTNGRFMDVMIFDGALGESDRQLLEGYLAWKWDIALPDEHPYAEDTSLFAGTADSGVLTLDGGAGDDVLISGGGADTLAGGDGNDTASFVTAEQGVVVDLDDNGDATTGNDGYGNGDVLTSIENLVGGSAPDTLTGNSADNVIEGGGGDDTLDGEGGNDTVSYASASGGVTVDLGAGTASGAAGNDTFSNFQNVIGSAHDDTLRAGDTDGQLEGGAGDDVIGAAPQAVWTPLSISSLMAWLDGSDIDGDWVEEGGNEAGLLVNQRVATWRDKTGNGYNIRGHDASHKKPNIEWDSESARYMVKFADDWAQINDLADAGVGALVSVTEDVQDGATLLADMSHAYKGWSVRNGHTSDEWRNVNPGAMYHNGELVNWNQDDAYDATWGEESTIIVANTLDFGGYVGQARVYDHGENARLKDLMIFDAPLSDSDRHLLEGFVAWKWGGTLDADHPYAGESDLFAGSDSGSGPTPSLTLLGGAGDDVLISGAGLDTLDGGDDTDTASFVNGLQAVEIDLDDNGDATAVNDGFGNADTLTSIENLVGGSTGDTLSGNSGANVIEGGFGADTLDGEGGIDTVSYENATGAVTVDLAAGTASGADGNDTLSNFENVIGSAHDDTLTGDGGANVIEGRGGADTLDGGAGADYLHILASQVGNLAAGAVDGGADGDADEVVVEDMSGTFDLGDFRDGGGDARAVNFDILDLRNDTAGDTVQVSLDDLAALTSGATGGAEPISIRLDSGDTFTVTDDPTSFDESTTSETNAKGEEGNLYQYTDVSVPSTVLAEVHIVTAA